MATPIRTKRMARERQELEKTNPDYTVLFPSSDNLFSFTALIFGPADTLYAHKLIQLHFTIPEQYPMIPPQVKHIQHSSERLHPNLYADGKVCLSILGTWAGEPWAYSMTCHSVLITIRSLLDNAPYRHEPGDRDHPGFNRWVRYGGWRALLLDHLRHGDADVRAKVGEYLKANREAMRAELVRQAQAETKATFHTPYRSTKRYRPEYDQLIEDLDAALKEVRTAPPPAETKGVIGVAKRRDSSMETGSPVKRAKLDLPPMPAYTAKRVASLPSPLRTWPSVQTHAAASSSAEVNGQVHPPPMATAQTFTPSWMSGQTFSPLDWSGQAFTFSPTGQPSLPTTAGSSTPTRTIGQWIHSSTARRAVSSPSTDKGSASPPHRPPHKTGEWARNIARLSASDAPTPPNLPKRLVETENTSPQSAKPSTATSKKGSTVEVIDLT